MKHRNFAQLKVVWALVSAFLLIGGLLFGSAVQPGLTQETKDTSVVISDSGNLALGTNQRQITLLEIARRPADPWPRGDGHALIGEPGSPLSQKAYHEPGGSFTPSPGSFGVSFWVRDSQGRLVATSDSIPVEKIQQRYVYRGGAKIPGIEDITPYYTSRWFQTESGRWQLEFKNTASTNQIEIVFRSVGPAGGPLKSVIWDNSRLLLNRGWIITAEPAPKIMVIGDESKGELHTAKPQKTSINSDTGWGFARLNFDQPNLTLRLTDTRPQFASALSYEKTVPQFDFQIPDKRFEESLRSQVATLMMGYIGRQTAPGELINYPLAWERDGAYSLTAMAKCGQIQTAKELSVYFAENDFFGGFGAEADAPGSAVNALIEIAFLLNDPSYFQWLWPNVVRKIDIIDEMMNAKSNIYKEYIGPLVPRLLGQDQRHQLICQAAQDGLIVGSMDLHFPILYINAISYLGLIQAARLATTLGKTDEAADWRAKAEKLRTRWMSAFGQTKYDNERNFIVSVWPSWIINQDFKPFVDQFEARRTIQWNNGIPKQRPLWTYFTVSEAHQWLFLERPDYTWETMNYFFENQCAPGLYTFWEGSGEENSFKQWENYRGWIKPRYVTPHYWTAAEMLHLQLDMLVYVDESKPDFELVIGGGVPISWLRNEISVKGYRTKAGIVSWEYRNGELKVTVVGAPRKYAVRPGINFRKTNTKLVVNYE